jgi:hypothetical protein
MHSKARTLTLQYKAADLGSKARSVLTSKLRICPLSVTGNIFPTTSNLSNNKWYYNERLCELMNCGNAYTEV